MSEGTVTDPVTSLLTATYYLDDLPRTVDNVTDGALTEYAYDGLGSRAARADRPCLTCDRAMTTYTYSAAEKLTSMTGVISGTTSFTYDAAGRPATRTHPTGAGLTYAFADDDTLTSLTAGTAGSFSYTYDQAYRILTQGHAGPTGVTDDDESTFSYGYDTAGRLTSFTDASGARTIGVDPDGNRTSYAQPGGSVISFAYNADDSIRTETRAGTTRTYDQDGAGRLTEDFCSTYAYDGFDRRTQATVTGSGCAPEPAASFTFDALDRARTRPGQDAGQVDLYDGLGDALVRGGNGALYALDPTGVPVGMKDGGAEQHLSGDGHGNVAVVTSASGALACGVRYDPFGTSLGLSGTEEVCDTGSAPSNEVLYRGAVREGATGTYRFGSRDYDPAKAGFLTPDSYRAEGQGNDLSVGADPLTRNSYAYVNGDPVNLIDPDGHRPLYGDGYGRARDAEQRKVGANACAAELYVSLVSHSGACAGRFRPRTSGRMFGAIVRGMERFGNCSLCMTITRGAAAIGVAATVCAFTAGLGCAVLGGAAAGGAVSVASCPDGRSLTGCAGPGAVEGAAWGLAFYGAGRLVAPLWRGFVGSIGRGGALGRAASTIDDWVRGGPQTTRLNLPFGDAGLRSQIYDVVRNFDEFGRPPAGVAQGGLKGYPSGTYGGQGLPSNPLGYYTESDVWLSGGGVKRGAERLVFGRGGEAYYTPNHYNDFIRIR